MNKKTNSNFSLRKLLLTALVAGPLATLPAPLWAIPSVASTNLTVSSGAPAPTVVSATSLAFGSPSSPIPDKSVYSWVEFGGPVNNQINAGETLSYFLPSASGSVLNLVSPQGPSATIINGSIISNGNVWVLNKNGVVVGGTAQIQTGGFFASTIDESLASAIFALNGKLSYTGTATNSVVVQNGANIQATGTGNAISFYGKGVDIQGGNFFGNLTVNSQGGNATFGTGGQVTVNSVNNVGGKLSVTTLGGNAILTGGSALLPGGGLTVTTTGGTPTTAPIIYATVGGSNTTKTDGQLSAAFTIVNGGAGFTTAPSVTVTDASGASIVIPAANVTLTGGVITNIALPSYAASGSSTQAGTNSMIVTGGLAVDTTTTGTGAAGTTGGNIFQGASTLVASGGASSLITGTGTSAGSISLGAAVLGALSTTANNVTIVAPHGGTAGDISPSSSDITLSASSIAGNLSIYNNGGQIAAGTGNTSVGGNIALSQSGNQLDFHGSGNVTFTVLQATSTVNVTGTADINLPYNNITNAPNFGSATTPTFTITASPVAGQSATLGTPVFTNGVLTSLPIATPGSGYGVAPIITMTTNVPGQAPIYIATTVSNGQVTGVAALPTTNFNTIGATSATIAGFTGTSSAVTPTFNDAGQITGVTATFNQNATTFVVGQKYQISTSGNTDFTAVGAANNNVGTFFTATGAGVGSGVAIPAGFTTAPSVTVTGTAGSTQTFATTLNTNGTIASIVNPLAGGAQGGVVTTQNGTSQIGRQLTVSTTGGRITGGIVATGSTTTLTASGDILLAGLNADTGNSGSVTITAGGNFVSGFVKLNGGGTIKAANNVTVGGYTNGLLGNFSDSNAALTVTSTAGSITAGSITNTTTSGLTLVSTGDISLPQTSFQVMSVTSTTGRILQNANTYVQQNGTSSKNSLTLNALSDIILNNNTLAVSGNNPVSNDINQLVIVGGGGGGNGVSINGNNNNTTLTNGLAKAIILANGTKATGSISITSFNDIILGTPVTNALGKLTNGTDTISVVGALNLTAQGATALSNFNNPLSPVTGTINTYANTISATGGVTLNTSNNLGAVLGTPGLGNLANYNFGSVNGNVGTGTLTVNENTTLNLGTITAGTINATSLGGDIINTGAINATTVNVAANTIFAPGNITLTNSGNLINALNIVNANNLNFAAGPLTGAAVVVTAGSTTTAGRAVVGAANVSILGTGNTLSMGTVGGGSYGTVGFTANGGNVSVTNPGPLTIQNATNTGAGTATFTAAGAITLGSGIALSSTGATTFTSTGANAGISDSASGISIFGPVTFTSDNSISITKAGHSLGAVSLITTGVNGANGTDAISYTEGGTANLNQVVINNTQNASVPAGSLSITSTGGSIVQTPTTGFIYVPSPSGQLPTATFTAATGSVTLTNPAGTNSIVPAISISASGNSSVAQTSSGLAIGNLGQLTLGNISVGAGTFTADTSLGNPIPITQVAGSKINVYGASTFTTKGGAAITTVSSGGAITLTNTGNNFGGLTLNTTNGVATGAAVSITESGTMNLLSVNTGTTGAFTAKSETASIIETGTAGIIVGGATSLTAAAAGINLNTTTTTNTFGGSNGILFSTTGNLSIQDANVNTVLLPSSTVGGTVTIKNSNGAGVIRDAGGSLAFTGATSFDVGTTGASSVQLTGGNNQFGALLFRAGTGGVAVSELTTLNLAPNSYVAGPANFTSFGNIITSGAGGSTFTSTLKLVAFGSITISNPFFVAGQLTFSSVGATDLSALSLAGNLNGIAPINSGASSYKAPGP